MIKNNKTTSTIVLSNILLFFKAIIVLGIAFSISIGTSQAKPKYAGVVVDARTGKVLYSNNANSRRYPASLTKMMTLYQIFDALEKKTISKNTRIKFSRNASNEVPSKLGIRPGRSITVEQAILALVTKSANDVATAVAEKLGGSEQAFARKMTRTARKLGMNRTVFKNAHGLPNTKQVTTAYDMARLGLALREHFPQYYRYFSTRSFKFGKRRYGNHNRLLGRVRGVDGIKTGYTRAAGFNLVSSVQHKKRKVVAVVMGGRSGAKRNAQMKRLIKKYLMKASTRGNKKIIAPRAKPKSFAVYAALPKHAPKPKMRGNASGVITSQVLALNSRFTIKPPVPASRPLVGKKALAAQLRKQQAEAKNIKLAKANKPVISKLDKIVTASISAKKKPIKGWVIQVGAAPDLKAAEKLLSKARKKSRGTLKNSKPFTVKFLKNDATYYRARFAGFTSKSKAWRACKSLKKAGIGCWAEYQS